MSSYLLTGASGFVGGALAAFLLRRGDRIVTILRDGDAPLGCDVIRGSITDPEVVRRAVNRLDLDGAFHLAAHAKVEECDSDPLGAWESNVRGTYTLLEHLRYEGFPVVVASSDHAYGDHPVGSRPSGEDDPPAPGGGIYDVSKTCADMIAMCYGEQGVNVRVVRCGNIYGPGDTDLSRAVPSFISDALAGRRIQIRSDGTPVREYLHVDDAVAAYVAAMERGRHGQAYNFAGGYPLNVRELAGEVNRTVRCFGVEPKDPLVLGTRRGEIRQIRLSTEKARAELHWEPRTTLAQGLWHTVDWWTFQKVRQNV